MTMLSPVLPPVPPIDPTRDLWVFAYGSLMWNPGFAHRSAETAVLHGYHRVFRLYSYRYRGTEQVPGLVLGLDRGGSCRGIAYRVAPSEAPAVMDYLVQREMNPNGVYHCRRVTVRAESGAVPAIGFVINRTHAHYTGPLSDARTAELICQGSGERGTCRTYFENTLRHLDQLGIRDENLHRLRDLVEGRRTAE